MAIGLAKNCTSFAAFTRVDSVRLAVCEEHATGPMLDENIFCWKASSYYFYDNLGTHGFLVLP